MSIESIILKINHELISSFAELDSWFDCDEQILLGEFPEGQWTIAETLEHIMLVNHHLLLLIMNTGSISGKRFPEKNLPGVLQDYILELPEMEYLCSDHPWSLQDNSLQPRGHKTLAEIRRQLRDQLHSCLWQLDLLANGDGMLFRIRIPFEPPSELDTYQSLYLLALYAKRHCSQLSRKIPYPVDWLV
jgi:hypothetical protein